ncbi:MAG: DEAD/DEAH box helicase [Nocardioidaceae bacterium]
MTLQHAHASLSPADKPDAHSGFAELGVPTPLVDALAARGITAPFPIQAATLPDSLAGRDVLGRGRTGSGKTVAFALPTIAALSASGRKRRTFAPRALILVPTRELAAQVYDAMAPLAHSLALRAMTVFGGVGQNPQVSKLRAGVDICVATPGRLEDLISQGFCRLDAVEVTVLDEADHMADLGFLPAVKRLLDQTPSGTQRLLFSATLDGGVAVIVRRYLHEPVTHSVDSESSHVPAMTHHVFTVAHDDKPHVVRELVSGQGRTLAFTRTKHAAKKLARQLTAAGVPAVDLHGNLSQNARQRNLAAFGSGEVRVLVATDIAARGIHVDDVALVVHVDPPTEHKAYLHRSGRTARAGAEGVVVTVGTHEQSGDVRVLMRQASIKPTMTEVRPGHPVITALTGEPAALVSPPPMSAKTGDRSSSRNGSPRGGARRGRSRAASPGGSTSGRSGAVTGRAPAAPRPRRRRPSRPR